MSMVNKVNGFIALVTYESSHAPNPYSLIFWVFLERGRMMSDMSESMS